MKKLLFLLFFVLAASTGTILAVQVDGIWYNFDDSHNTAQVTYRGSAYNSYSNRYSGSIVIPNSVTYNNTIYSVTSIGDHAFHYCAGLTSVEIPNSVTSIGDYAFYDCRGLTSVEISNGVTSIGDYAFYDCRGLTSVEIPNSVLYIGDHAFHNCTGLTSVEISNGVTSIGNSSFQYCASLTSVTIPNSVTSIGDNAFVDCIALSTVILGNGITSIGNHVFYIEFSGSNLPLTNIYVPCGELLRYQCLLPQFAEIIRYEPSIYSLTIKTSTNGYVNASSHTICDTIVVLEPMPYYGYHFIRWSDGDTNNPRTIELTQDTIFEAIFAPNKYYVSVTCDSVRGLIEGASGEFDYLTELTYTAIPNYGYHFDIWSDGETQNPRTITISADSSITASFAPNKYLIQDGSNSNQGNISGIGSFDYMSKRTITAVPSQGYYFEKWADGNTDNPRTIELTQDTTMEAIFDYLLTSKCGKDSVLTWTFEPSTMTLEITGKGALSENYTYGTFIESLTIGNEVTTIGQSAFYGCNNLKNVIIGSSVKVLEETAFSGCSAIETITCYSQRPPTVNNYALYGLDYSTIVYVPADYLNTYIMHDAWGLYDVRPLGAKTTETTEVNVTPSETTAEVAWPSVTGAVSYELVIKDKDGNVICTLVFNANGQLTSIAFNAPSRDHAPMQTQTAGFEFTVTGLEEGESYDLTITSKDSNGAVLDQKTVSFTTGEEQGIDHITNDQSPINKVMMDSQILILRGDKTYTLTGQEVR